MRNQYSLKNWIIKVAIIMVIIPCAGWFGWRLFQQNHDRLRDQRLVTFFRTSQGTPYQWKAKEVIYDYSQVRRAILTPRTQEGTPSQIRQGLDTLEKEIKLGVDWQENPPILKLPRTDRPPEIDGIPDDIAWSQALSFYGEYPLNSNQNNSNSSIWMLVYDQEYLYFAVVFNDKNCWSADSPSLYHGDALELFIMPEIRYYTYVELVFSPDGRKYTQWVNQTLRGRYELSEYHPKSLKIATRQDSNGYMIEGRIGFRDLPGYLRGNPAQPGETIRLMMLRINSDGIAKPTTSTPIPFLYDGHNYFGYMTVTLQ